MTRHIVARGKSKEIQNVLFDNDFKKVYGENNTDVFVVDLVDKIYWGIGESAVPNTIKMIKLNTTSQIEYNLVELIKKLKSNNHE